MSKKKKWGVISKVTKAYSFSNIFPSTPNFIPMWAAMHVTSITSHSWLRNFTINQLSEPIKPVYNFRPDERASQYQPRHWTVCGRELKVIMNNSGSNVYKNTKRPFTTKQRRQASNCNVAVRDLFSNPHSYFWNYFTHTDKKWKNINENSGVTVHKKPRIPFTAYRLLASRIKEMEPTTQKYF